jgi:uncharacterized protein YkwD
MQSFKKNPSLLLLMLLMILMLFIQGCGRESSQPLKQESPQAEEVLEGEEFFDKSIPTLNEQYLELLNEHRLSLNLRPLTLMVQIEEVSHSHSRAMARRLRPFGHFGFSLRCRELKSKVGPFRRCGEVVAMGQKTPVALLRAWLNSPGHREEIESPHFTHTGLGIARNSQGVIYWTQMLLEL